MKLQMVLWMTRGIGKWRSLRWADHRAARCCWASGAGMLPPLKVTAEASRFSARSFSLLATAIAGARTLGCLPH